MLEIQLSWEGQKTVQDLKAWCATVKRPIREAAGDNTVGARSKAAFANLLGGVAIAVNRLVPDLAKLNSSLEPQAMSYHQDKVAFDAPIAGNVRIGGGLGEIRIVPAG